MNELKKHRVGVLCGGHSPERHVSEDSGEQVYQALVSLGVDAVKIDPATSEILDHNITLAFNVLHGVFGEDGTVQAYLDYHNIPYTGSNANASILGMNKYFTKKLLERHNIPTPPYAIAYENNKLPTLPPGDAWVLKPINQGSSIGVKFAKTPEDVKTYSHDIIDQYGPCLIETFIDGQEITASILDDGHSYKILPLLELNPENAFYDYEAKYTPGKTEFILPANLTQAQTDLCGNYALQVHKIIKCQGVSRVDMRVHAELGPMILEINTIPGMTATSDLPAQAKEAGISFEKLVESICLSALSLPSL